jgi:hypothetical protein
MSCSCNNSCDPEHEPLPSTVDNFVTQFFGEITKTCVDGKVIWTLPCNLDDGIPGYPRVPGEGLACYFARVINDIAQGGGGGGGTLPDGNYGDVSVSNNGTTILLNNSVIETTNFASTIQPVSLKNSVPLTKDTDVIFNITDGKLYRWNGSSYTAAVPVVDLTGQIVSGQIADNAILQAKLADNAVSQAKLQNSAVSSEKIAAGAVTTLKLSAGAVTANEIAANTIIANNIAANAIVAAKLAAGAVEADKIAANAVTAGKIDVNAVTAGTIAAGAVNTAALAAGSVTADKMFVDSLSAITANLGTATAGIFKSGAATTFNSGNGFFLGKDVDDIYKFRVGNPSVGYISWDGSTWQVVNLPTGEGFDVKDPVRVATTGSNITLSGGAPAILDSIPLSVTNRVLVKDQTNPVQNGIYVVTTLGSGSNGTWTRATDADVTGELNQNAYAFVEEGTDNASSSWVVTSPDPVDIGIDPIYWTKFFSVTSISFGSIVGTIDPSQIADGSIAGTKFASGIKPIEIVSELPSSGNFQGRVVFLTQADGAFAANKLYRWTSSTITTGKLYWTAAVPAVDITGQISSGQIADGSIAGTKFASGIKPIEVLATLPLPGTVGRVVFLTSDYKLYRDTGTSWTAVVPAVDITGQISAGQIADGSISGTKFASGVKPIEVLGSLPAAGTAGRVVFLTTDSKLYRDTGSAWTVAVPAADLTGQITTVQISNTAITSDKIATNAITAEKITANAITSDKITANAITSDKITANAITSDKISANSITTGMIQAGAVSASQIAAGAITAGKLAADSVTAANIAAGSILADKIATNAITSSKIAADAITTGMIQAGAVTAAQIAANGITADKIAANAVTAVKIAAGAIESDKIATNAITSDKITANAITTGMIQAGAISASQIAAEAVTAGKLAANAVTADTIAANAVTAGKIIAGAVTADKMSVASLSAITANLGTATAGTFKSAPAVTFSSGTGFFIGQDTDTVYKLRVGDPAANYFSWNGSKITVVGDYSAGTGDGLLNATNTVTTFGNTSGRHFAFEAFATGTTQLVAKDPLGSIVFQAGAYNVGGGTAAQIVLSSTLGAGSLNLAPGGISFSGNGTIENITLRANTTSVDAKDCNVRVTTAGSPVIVLNRAVGLLSEPEIWINGQKVVKARYTGSVTNTAEIIACLQYHGLCN